MNKNLATAVGFFLTIAIIFIALSGDLTSFGAKSWLVLPALGLIFGGGVAFIVSLLLLYIAKRKTSDANILALFYFLFGSTCGTLLFGVGLFTYAGW